MDKVVLAGTPKHLELSAELGKNKRDFLLLNISGTCNYNCKKCCNLVPNKRVGISLSQVKSIISEAREKFGIRSVAFIGEGETTLAPNFKEIIRHANSEKLHSIIFTNGYFINPQMAKFLESNNVSIVFSVDSLKKGAYEELTGTRGTFDRVMKNIKNCRRIYSEKIKYENNNMVLFLAINMLLMKSNIGEIKTLKKFCGNDILPIFNYPMITGNAENNLDLFGALNKTGIKKLKELAFKSSPNKGPTNICPHEEICGYFKYGLSIGCDGSILPCPYSLEYTNILGNIRELKLENALETQKTLVKDFRKLDEKCYCIMRSSKYKELLSKYRRKSDRKN
ncbi:MAG: radical SAM protein [Candidatus Diapherotrites archaeon]